MEQMNTGLVGDVCVIKLFNVNQHRVKIFDSKWYDLSQVTSFDMSERFIRYTFHFWNTILRPYSHVLDDSGATDLKESTGILNLTFVQNPKIYKESLAILSLDSVLAWIGGYMNVVLMVLSQFTVFMNGFNLDMSLIKRLYSEDGRSDGAAPEVDNPQE